jgi:phage baseplate assembly protein W
VQKEAYTSDLLLLLLTQKGERYYEPDYGTNLIQYIFEQNDGITSNDILNEIKTDVSTYLPSITIKTVNFYTTADDPSINENQIVMHIDFVYTEDTYSEQNTINITF